MCIRDRWYYLSAAAAGGLVTTEPTISQPIVYVEDANNIFIFAYRPTNLLINGTDAIITGDNTVSTVKIQDDAVTADKLANSINTEITANTTKLAGIEASATADQTNAEIRSAVEAASDSNVFTDADHSKLNGVAASANNYVHPNHSGEVTSTADGATVIASAVVDEDNLKISNSGSDGNFLQKQSGNAGGLTWAAAGGAYSDWSIISGATNLAAKGQYVSNNGSAVTHTLPTASVSGGNDGDSIIVCNAGAGTVTLARNSSNINSAAADGTLPQGNSVQLVYVDDTIGWFEI